MFTHNLHPPQCQQQGIKHSNVDITTYRIEIEPGSDCFDCEIPECGHAGGHWEAIAQHTDWPQIDTCHVGTPYRVCHQGLIITYGTGLNDRDNNVRKEIKLLTRWGRDKMNTISISFPNPFFFKRLKNHCNLFLRVQLIINQNWFRQWLGREKTLSHYLSQWWSRLMVYLWVSRIDWVDYFTRFGKYIHAEKNGTVWAHEGYLHPHSWKWAIPKLPHVGWGRGTGWPYINEVGWLRGSYLWWLSVSNGFQYK